MKKIVSFFGKDNKTFACLNRQAKEYARSKGLDFEWSIQEPYCAEDVIARLQDADAGIIDIEPYGENIFPHICHRTKLLVRFGVGYDKVDLGAASKYGIAIARTTGANTMGVAEMTVTLMLAARRELNFNQSVAASGSWGRRSISNETVGGTIGIVGFGAVGQAVARLVSGFGCRVLVYNPRPKPEAEALGAEQTNLETLFSQADAISINAAYNEASHHLVNARLLGLMKPEAVIVNTSRGAIIDDEALYDALVNHRIRGAALDVFAQEPFPADCKYLGLDNVILTPHVASQTMESLWRIYAKAIDITADFFAGRPVKDILNPDYNT